MLDREDFLMRAIAFMISVNGDIQLNLKLSEGAQKSGDEDTADYYAIRAIAQKQVYNKFSAFFDDLLPVSDITIIEEEE